MKILWVKAGGLVPPDTGGKIRSYNILRQLARGHEITFFSFYAAHDNDVHAELTQVFQRVLTAPLNLPSAKSAAESLNYLLHVFSYEPYNLTKYCRPEVRHKLRSILQADIYDVVLCDFLAAAPAVPWDWPGAKVIFTHNVEAVIWKRHYEMARNPFWKALSWYEWKRMAIAERRYLKKADHVLTVSAKDRDTFLKFLKPQRLTVTQTGVDTEFFQPRVELEVPNSMVFCGSMDWLPNEDGIFYFVKEIFPLIRRQLPDASLQIVGRQPSGRLKDLVLSDRGIRLTGRVDDVRPYVAQSPVSIVPLRIGGGTRLKIFEAMSMAKPVVSTSIGAEGLPVKNGEHIVIADVASAFAASTVQLLGDVSQRARIGRAARKLVEENYSWGAVSTEFARTLQSVINQSRQASHAIGT